MERSEASPALSSSARLAATVELARKGDAAAFEALVRHRIDAVFRTAWSILGNEADARDVTQEAFVSAWRELPRLRNLQAFEAWLDQITVNQCRAALRRRGRVREVEIEPIHDRASAADVDPAAIGERDALTRALDRLTADQRAVLVLHHLRGESLGTIAAALDVPEGTVKSRLHSARSALEAALAAERR